MKDEFLNLDGNPVERNPITNPYTYDPYVIYKDKTFDKSKVSAYFSDRIEGWYDSETQEKALKKIGLKRYGDSRERFSWSNPSHVKAFLSELKGKDIRVSAIMQGANHATGNPYWIVYVQEVTE